MVERVPLEFDVTLKQEQLKRDTRQILGQLKALDRAFTRLSPKGASQLDREMKKAALSTSRLAREVRNASSATSNLGRTAQLTAKRFLVYNVIARFFFALANAIQEGTQAFIAFDQELNKARQILNPLITDFDEFTKTIFELANAFGVTVKEVQAAQEVFIRQGKTQAQVTDLTRAALALGAAAGLEFAQSTEAITASLNQFTSEGLLAIDISDKFTAVSIRNAVTADDLAQAIFRAGSAASTVGVQFNNLIGFITAAQEATRRGGRVIGTGLRTIFTRIFRAPSIEAIQELGIEVRKASGEFKNADDLITALAGKFKDLSQTQQISIASTIAGQRQVATFLALLRNFESAQSAANDALLSQGEAARLVRIRQEALSAQITKISTQFQRFGKAIGEAISGTIVSDVRSIADSFAAFASVIENSGPLLGILAKSLSTVGVILVAQLLGLGRAGAALKSYGSGIKQTKKELAVFTREQERAGAATSFLARALNKIAGPTKQFENDAAQFKLRKLIAGEEILINRTKVSQLKSAQQIKIVEAQELQILNAIKTTNEGNANIKKALSERAAQELKLNKANLKVTQLSRNLTPSQDNLNNLREEGKQIRQNLKDRRSELAAVVGSAGRGAGRGREGLAKQGLILERDRINVAQKLLRIEDKIARLKSTAANTAGRTDIQRGRTRQLLEKNIGKQSILTASLRKNASEQEIKIVRAIARERLKLATIAKKRTVATNALVQQEIQISAAKQTVLTIEQEIADIGLFIEQTQNAIKIITLETAKAELDIKAAKGQISRLDTEQLKLLNAKLKLEQAIVKQKERAGKQDERAKRALTRRGAGGTGVAIGLSLGLNAVSEVLRENKREGDKTTEAIAQGFDAAGGIAVTAMLLPLGPISLALIGLQAIIATTKIVKTFTGAWADEADRVNQKIDNLTNALRANKTIFEELRNISAQIQLEGLSISSLKSINEQIATIKKNFKDIPTEKFARIEGSLRKAVRTNDIGKIEELSEALDKIVGEGIIANNIIPEKLVLDAIKLRDTIRELQRDLNNPNFAGDLGKGFTELQVEALKEKLDDAKDALKELRNESGKSSASLISGFLQASSSSETFGQNLVRLKFEDLADAAGFLNVLNEEFLRTKKGFDVTTDSAEALREAVRENADLFNILTNKLDDNFGAVTQVQKALRQTEQTAGKNATVFFQLDKSIDTTTERFKQFAEVLTEQITGGFDEKKIANTIDVLTDSLSEGTGVVRGYIDEQGELVFKLKGIPGVIGPASQAYIFLRNIVEENGIFAGIAENAFDSFGDSQLSNSRITDLLAQKYLSLAKNIQDTANVLSRTSDNITTTIGLNNELANSFPEKALEVNLKQFTALKDRAAGLRDGLDLSINSLNELDKTLNNIQLTLSTRITDAFFAGGDASIDFSNRLQVASEVVDEVDSKLQRFESRIKATDFGSGQFDSLKESALNLTKELLIIEKFSGAVLGLASLKEKLLKEDGEILDNDIGLLIKFQKILQKGFDFKEIDIGPDTLGNKKQLAKEIDIIVQNLSSTFIKTGETLFGRAGQKIGVALVTETNTTLSTGGDTIAKRLDTVLTAATNKLTEKLREPVEQLRASLGSLRDEGVASLSALVDAANTQIGTLGQIISKGIIPPDQTLTDILVGQFTVANEASEIAIGKIQSRLNDLKVDRKILAKIEADAKKSNVDEIGRGQKIRDARQAVLALDGQILEQNTKLTAEEKKQLTLLAGINNVLVQSIQRIDNSLKGVFTAQRKVISAETKLFTSRLSFIDLENATLGRRLEILKLERDTFEGVRRSISGIEQTDVGGIGDKIVELSKEAIGKSLKDAASSEFIQTRITQLKQQLNVEDQIAQLRVKNLQKELDLLKKQDKQISSLGLSFAKATDEQQRGIIRAARLTEKFFGGIGSGPQGPNTNQVRSSILSFLKNSDEQTRKSVIGQLEQLKAAGGEVAPGVPAAKILGQIGKLVGDALFKSPAIAIAERQEQVQRDILTAQGDTNDIARVQLRVTAATLRAQSSLAASVAKRVVAAGGTGGEALRQVQITRQSVSQVTGAVDNLLATQKERASLLIAEKRVTDAAAVSNKKFIDATRKVDLALQEGGLSIEEFKSQAVELRSALVDADDAFIDAQQAITDSSNGISIALANAAAAQADYNLGIIEANRENLTAVGGFQTYRDELSFLTDAFNQQISTLRQVGSTEQQIAQLRIQLAQQQLSIFEQQISNVRQNARQLLTQDSAGLQFFQAGAAASLAADLAAKAGITPDGDVTNAQQDELARAILSLPLEIRQDLDKAFSNAPPGQTAGDFGLGQLETIILSALGGRGANTPDLLTLEQQAAQQRIIIAENSTSQLESTRTATIAAFDQLATAQESLLETKANKELAQLQLSALEIGFSQQNSIMDIVADRVARNTTIIETESQKQIEEMKKLGQTIEIGLAGIGERSGQSGIFDSAGNLIQSAAGGTLTGSEVAGLLRAASREKSAMPGGAGLGVFNTSETILTKAQINRLRSGPRTPNAINGTGVIASDEVVGLLRDISTRVGELRQKGITQQITVGIENNRRVSIDGLAGLQTALQDIIGDRTGELYTREEAIALEQVVQTILTKLRDTGQLSAIGT